MDDPAAVDGMIAKNRERITDRVAAVDQNRFVHAVGQLNLADKGGLVAGVIVFVPVVVQTDLPDRRDILIIDQEFLVYASLLPKNRADHWDESHRDVKTVVFSFHFQGGFGFFQPAADDHHPRDAGLQRPLADALGILDQVRAGQMTVRVNPA